MKKDFWYKVRRNLIVLIQALLVVLAGASILTYISLARMTNVRNIDAQSTYIPNIRELRQDYYESDGFLNNFRNTVSNVFRYVTIKRQVETDGEFDPYKKIPVGKYAYRNSASEYDGVESFYYLNDLILWKQYGFNHIYKTFDSFDDIDKYFEQGSKNDIISQYYNNSFYVSKYFDPDDEEDIDFYEGVPQTDTEGNTSAETESNIYISSDNGRYTVFDGNSTKESVAADINADSENVANDGTIEGYMMPSQNDTASTDYSFSSTYDVDIDSTNNSIPILDILLPRYEACDGSIPEDLVDDVASYNKLVSAIETSAADLYENYLDYEKYEDIYKIVNSNVRFCVLMQENERPVCYSNIYLGEGVPERLDVSAKFKDYGKYIYIAPDSLGFQTNLNIKYADVIDEMRNYVYSFADNAEIWIAIDTKLNVNDYYKTNFLAQKNALNALPWVISGIGISIVLFCFFIVFASRYEYVRLRDNGFAEALDDFDRLPIEVNTLFLALILAIIFISNRIITETFANWSENSEVLRIRFACAFLLLFVCVALKFVYALIRRIICKNVFENSLIAKVLHKLLDRDGKLRKLFKARYDTSGVAMRTWSSFALFLIFNTFWACMLFFSDYTILSFIVLFIFDFAVGCVLYKRNFEIKKITDGINEISNGNFDYHIDEEKMYGENHELAIAVNNVKNGLKTAVEKSTKDEKLKADLITNVSHDIKTPLTSIINYVDLLKRENIDNANVQKYIKVLDEKSQRLRQLTFDLVEASKISSGNISLDMTRIDFEELLNQALGEFEEKFEEKHLTPVLRVPEDEKVFVMADPGCMWRVCENFLNNIYKYAQEDTRIYLDLTVIEEDNKKQMELSVKNISKQQLNIPADELTERFIRGDVSRSTEGSGLGLSIAKSLMKAMGGSFEIVLDGDLFKVVIKLDCVE